MVKVTHILCMLEVCDKNILNDKNKLVNILKKAASDGEMSVLKISSVKFKPVGLSIILTIAESHIAIHTWPEISKADLEIVSCGKRLNSLKVLNQILKDIKVTNITKKVICLSL